MNSNGQWRTPAHLALKLTVASLVVLERFLLMALPPNGLTDLLEGTPEQMMARLIEQGCLTAGALADQQAVLEVIRSAVQGCEAFYAQHPGFAGPNEIDYVGRALVSSPYLSERGHQLYQTDTRDVETR